MAEISKHLFDSTCRHLHCDDILHPWSKSCFSFNTYLPFFIGSAKFNIVIHLLQSLLKIKKFKKREDVIRAVEYYLRSTLFGGLVGVTSVACSCLFRLLGRKFHYYTYICLPAMLSGLFILLEPPSRRAPIINLLCNMVVEYWLKTLQSAGFIKITKVKMTLMFMVGSSLLFYLMRLEADKEKRTPQFWLYTPEKVRQKEEGETNPCPHTGPCSKYILKGTATYFGVGLAFTLINLLQPLLKSPGKTLKNINGKHLKLSMFFGSYIGIYRLIVCWLCRKRGYDSAAHAIPAGALAGVSFMFKPNLGIAIASLSGAFKIMSTTLYEKKIITEKMNIPLLLYCISQGILCQARSMHQELCPSHMFKFFTAVSNGYLDLTDARLQELNNSS